MRLRSVDIRLLAALLLCAASVAAQTTPPVGESRGGDQVRFHASVQARDQAQPSLCLTEPWTGDPFVPADWSLIPTFSRIQGRPVVILEIPSGTDLYGTGEVPGPLRRNGTRQLAWNFDAYGWQASAMNLYQSHPWVLGVRPDGTGFGVLADTPQRCMIDLRDGIRFESAGPDFPVIVVVKDSPREVVMALSELTGTMPLPPLWALGYHQCRYSYTPDNRVREIAEGFRKRDIPCDVIWMDIDYMDGYRCFTTDPDAFPDMRALTHDLHEMDFHTVAIIDPGIKKEPGYHVYDSGEAIDAWVRNRHGVPYTGTVWPGECVFPDFTSGQVREWWGGLYGQFLSLGIDGVWNDMNEPAIFNVDGKTMPLDNRHRADPELGGPGDHARFHNVYGMLMARATFEGCRRVRPGTRPFVLTRANHLGGQRWAATWTGDNSASWNHLDQSVSMALNLGLSGQPLAGPDIGGFAGAGSGELFARWMGVGAFLPFARGHTGKGNIDKEPWSFGEDVEATCRRALKMRYRLLPYLYTLMREASVTGMPIVRPVFFADPKDPALRAEDDAFLLGNDVLVVCNLGPGDPEPVAMPKGDWRRFSLVEGDLEDPDLPALYLRAGAVLPVGPEVNVATRIMTLSDLTLIINKEGMLHPALGQIYLDDGDGYGYLEGKFALVEIESPSAVSSQLIKFQVLEGDWKGYEAYAQPELVYLKD